MKNIKWLFSLVLTVVLVAPGFAASDFGGCDNDENDMINPALALCSTHVYNIGQTENPTDEETRDLMTKVIAMKTSVIAQQLYRQYAQMDAMLNRLETQLEKAVLINRLKEASGKSGDGADGESGGKFKSDNPRIFMSAAQDCSNIFEPKQKITCVQHNLTIIESATNSGKNPTIEARKQLAQAAKDAEDVYVPKYYDQTCELKDKGKTRAGVDVTNYQEIKTKKQFTDAIDDVKGCLAKKTRQLQAEEMELRRN